MKRSFIIVSMLLLVSMIFSACQSATETPVVEVPVDATDAPVAEEPTAAPEGETAPETETAALSFSTPHPILGDVRVRQAMAYCTNKDEILAAVYPTLTEEERAGLEMNTFIPRNHWAYAGDENITIYPFDTEKGMALLEEAGWKDEDGDGLRTNADGDYLSLEFVLTEAAIRKTLAPVWQQQMRNCGFKIAVNHVPSAWLFGDTTGLARREFELADYAWVGQSDPQGRTLYACNQIPRPENNWEGQNSMGWCNEVASQAIVKAVNTINQADRIEPYKIVQQEFTKDMVSLPLFNRLEAYATNPNLQGFNPQVGEEYYVYNVADWEIPGKDTIVIGFTQEPASLFTLVESGMSAVAAHLLIQGMPFSTANYDFQPIAQTEPSTIDSGLATNSDVEVKEGDMVYDVVGNPVALAKGVKVYNAAGEIVEFDGSALIMKQIVSEIKFRPDRKWSDGEPVVPADYQLYHDIDCNPNSGATSYATCNEMQTFETTESGYKVTFLPGVQDPLYFRAQQDPRSSNVYPSHLVLSDGRKLAEVPAEEWATLPEIAEYPIGPGPYVLKEWVKGEKMVFEANPYYFGGAPKTKNIVIAFITPDNAEAQLLAGQVDILDATTLNSISDTLRKAADEGKVKTYALPGGTWEHIDMNLYLP